MHKDFEKSDSSGQTKSDSSGQTKSDSSGSMKSDSSGSRKSDRSRQTKSDLDHYPDKIVDDFLFKIKKNKLELPVSLLIEVNLPLNNIFANSILFLEPLLMPFFSKTQIKTLHQIIQDKEKLTYIYKSLKTT